MYHITIFVFFLFTKEKEKQLSLWRRRQQLLWRMKEGFEKLSQYFDYYFYYIFVAACNMNNVEIQIM